MNETQSKGIKDDSAGCPICSMMHDFYNRKMLQVVVLVWFWAVLFIAGAVYSGVRFFKTEQTRDQIMFAALFVCCWQGIAMIKVFAWLMIHRNALERQIKQIELKSAN